MKRPQTPGAGITGAIVSIKLGSAIETIIDPAGLPVQPYETCAQRLHCDLGLQRAINHLWDCGPRPVGFAFAELLDEIGAVPGELDRLFRWGGLDPSLVRALRADRFQERAPLLVPR